MLSAAHNEESMLRPNTLILLSKLSNAPFMSRFEHLNSFFVHIPNPIATHISYVNKYSLFLPHFTFCKQLFIINIHFAVPVFNLHVYLFTFISLSYLFFSILLLRLLAFFFTREGTNCFIQQRHVIQRVFVLIVAGGNER